MYKLYNNKEYIDCIARCDKGIEKDEYNLEAYYVKAISYFEMAQLPQRYEDFTKDPLMDCIRTLSALRAKDQDGEMWDEHADTMDLIYKYAEFKAQELKKTNKEKSILLYKRMMRAWRIQTSALEIAIIYAKVEDYERCMREVSRLYDKSPKEISSSHDNYEALCKGALLLAENWMFRDLFWLIETYKPKYESNYAINAGFKQAIMISVDTASAEEEKDFFFDFSKQGLDLYKDDAEFTSFIERIWLEEIDKLKVEFKNTQGERTWRDSVSLRNAYKLSDMSLQLLPENEAFLRKRKELDGTFHTVPYITEEKLFQEYALNAVNRWRTRGCECDTGYVFSLKPVYGVLWDTTLARLAKEHAEDMFCYNHTDHIDHNNINPMQRMQTTRLKGGTFDDEVGTYFVKAVKIGEVLGYGFSIGDVRTQEDLKKQVDGMVASWIDTRLSQNCPKIMTPNFTHMGMAVYGDKWVLFFGEINEYYIRKNK